MDEPCGPGDGGGCQTVLVELAASGTLQRIISFIGVDLMLLIVGYLAPLPPRKDAVDDHAIPDRAPLQT